MKESKGDAKVDVNELKEELKDDDNLEKQAKSKLKQEEKIKENKGKGNAYGKNKDGLVGREFGLARAADAKAKAKQYEESFEKNDEVIRRGKSKIQEAIERVKKAKEDKSLTEEEIKSKRRTD